MEFYNKAKEIINMDITEFTGGVTDDIINSAMKTLGVVFPESYKAFLSDFGSGDAGGEIIFGLEAGRKDITEDYGEEDTWDVVKITQMEHNYKMPGCMVVINYCSSNNSLYCLDTSKMKNGECPVVKVPGDYKNIETEAESFGMFFYNYVTCCLDDEY
ncbi:MAG: SMI1/KNR4 family protein [Lachnospiraceae bacterium]|nr:SMI1/KNR4 family protein [Lachnospiraceae bacterium]